jgi:hypothetical protein
VQAKDVPADVILRIVRDKQATKMPGSQNCWPWAVNGDIEPAFPDVPWKVVAAKLYILVRRGLLNGCTCGCRGDWELTDKGRAYLEAL